jgi:hypothetical protein
MKKTAWIIIVFCIFVSCEKQNEKQLNVENKGLPLISKVIIDGKTYTEYSYTAANLLCEEKSKFHYTKHFYNENNQLIESDFYWDIAMVSSNSQIVEAAMNREEWVTPENTPKSISHKLEYFSSGQLSRKSYIRNDEKYSDFVEFQYEGDRIVSSTGYYNNSVSGRTDYYYDTNGNVIKEMKYMVSPEGINQLITTTQYEYDIMHNPFLIFKRLTTPGVYTNSNNIVKETTTLNFDVTPDIEKVQVNVYSYEYNYEGYPVKVNGTTEYVYN